MENPIEMDDDWGHPYELGIHIPVDRYEYSEKNTKP